MAFFEKPYLDLDNLTKKRIIDLIEKCEELEIENVCFIYDPKLKTEVKFYMVKCEDYWELTVIQNWAKKRDRYEIKDHSLTYCCSLDD